MSSVTANVDDDAGHSRMHVTHYAVMHNSIQRNMTQYSNKDGAVIIGLLPEWLKYPPK